MVCPPQTVNSTGVCQILSETGSGIGAFADGLISGGGLIKLLLVLAVISGVVALFFAIVYVIKNAMGKGHKRY